MKSTEIPLTTTRPKQSKKKIEKGLGHWAHRWDWNPIKSAASSFFSRTFP